jgi:hypothetical protein
MIAFTYPIFLIVVCTVYAVLTRKIPEAFNESKHIGESDESLLCFCGSFGRGESLLVVFV